MGGGGDSSVLDANYPPPPPPTNRWLEAPLEGGGGGALGRGNFVRGDVGGSFCLGAGGPRGLVRGGGVQVWQFER